MLKKYYPPQICYIALFYLSVGKSFGGNVCKGVLGTGQPSVLNCNTLCFTVSTDILLPAKMAFLYSHALSASLNQTVSRRSSAASPAAPLPTSFATPKGHIFCTSGWAPHLQRAHSCWVSWHVLPRAICYSPSLQSLLSHLLSSKTSALSSLSRL